METSKTSSATFGDSNGDHEADEDGKESNNSTGASMDNVASSTASTGEKAKRLVVLPHHYGWEYLTKKKRIEKYIVEKATSFPFTIPS